MQKSIKVFLLAALFLMGVALARRQDNEAQPDDGNGNENGRPHHGGKGPGGHGGKKFDPAKMCERISKDCEADGQQPTEGATEVTTLDDMCDQTLCVDFLGNHKCFLGCAGKCHHENPDDQDAQKTCAEACLTCVDPPAPEGAPEEEPTERMVEIIKRAVKRQEEENNNNNNQNENNGERHHGKGKKGKGKGWGKGGKGHHGGKGGKGHGGKKNPCKKIQHKCVKEGIIPAPQGSNNNNNNRHLRRQSAAPAPAPALTNISQLCQEETCEAFIANHQCFVKCAKDCHRDNEDDDEAALLCKNGCLSCVDPPKNASNNQNATAPTQRRRQENQAPADAPADGEGEGEGEGNGQQHHGKGKGGKGKGHHGGKGKGKGKGGEEPAPEDQPTERRVAAVVSIMRRQEEDGAPADGEGEGEGEGNGQQHHGKGKGGHHGGKGGKGPHGPPDANEFCERVGEQCANEAAPASRTTKEDLCDQATCVEFIQGHQCFFPCMGECFHQSQGDKDAAEACIEEKCFDCTAEEYPAPEQPESAPTRRTRRIVRHRINRH